MSKSDIISMAAGSNAISDKDFVEQDGAGAVKAFDGTGRILGIAHTDKDANNNVGVIKSGQVSVASVAATYNAGDQVEWTTGQKVQAFTTGVMIPGTVVKTKTTTTTDNKLLLYVSFQ